MFLRTIDPVLWENSYLWPKRVHPRLDRGGGMSICYGVEGAHHIINFVHKILDIDIDTKT